MSLTMPGIFIADETDGTGDLIVHLPNAPVSPSQISPDVPEKRSRGTMEDGWYVASDKENALPSASTSYSAHASKRAKTQAQPPRLAPLTINNNPAVHYDPYPTPAYTYIPHPHTWRPDGTLGVPPPHLSPYPTDWSNPGSDYSRSPVPEPADTYHPHITHLAPVLTPGASTGTTPDPSMYPGSIAPTSQPPSATYYTRGYVPQPMDYLNGGHPTYDYGSPYLTDAAWENPFNSQQSTQ